jgi:hypothetical protein
MQVSAEIRWFWKAADVPKDLEEWFCSGRMHKSITAGGGSKIRTDHYLKLAGQHEIGIKRRDVDKDKASNSAEIKGLVAASISGLSCVPFTGPVELWTKWSAAIDLHGADMLPTNKKRWLRKFATDGTGAAHEIQLGPLEEPLQESLPELGCNVELTRIELEDSKVWWSFGFESFGALDSVARSLAVVAAELAHRAPPAFTGARLASYPSWLNSEPRA